MKSLKRKTYWQWEEHSVRPCGYCWYDSVNPAATKTYFKGFVVFNGNTTTGTVNLYLAEDNVGALDTVDAATKPQQFIRQEFEFW